MLNRFEKNKQNKAAVCSGFLEGLTRILPAVFVCGLNRKRYRPDVLHYLQPIQSGNKIELRIAVRSTDDKSFSKININYCWLSKITRARERLPVGNSLGHYGYAATLVVRVIHGLLGTILLTMRSLWRFRD